MLRTVSVTERQLLLSQEILASANGPCDVTSCDNEERGQEKLFGVLLHTGSRIIIIMTVAGSRIIIIMMVAAFPSEK